MSDTLQTLFVVGTGLTAGAVGLATFGVLGLLGVGVALMCVGALGALGGHSEDAAGSAECPDCGTKNWADRATCRNCSERLL